MNQFSVVNVIKPRNIHKFAASVSRKIEYLAVFFCVNGKNIWNIACYGIQALLKAEEEVSIKQERLKIRKFRNRIAVYCIGSGLCYAVQIHLLRSNVCFNFLFPARIGTTSLYHSRSFSSFVSVIRKFKIKVNEIRRRNDRKLNGSKSFFAKHELRCKCHKSGLPWIKINFRRENTAVFKPEKICIKNAGNTKVLVYAGTAVIYVYVFSGCRKFLHRKRIPVPTQIKGNLRTAVEKTGWNRNFSSGGIGKRPLQNVKFCLA